MTQPRDIERLLDHWFADGSSVAPDRVVDVVADRIERQPQRPAWRLDWRHLTDESNRQGRRRDRGGRPHRRRRLHLPAGHWRCGRSCPIGEPVGHGQPDGHAVLCRVARAPCFPTWFTPESNSAEPGSCPLAARRRGPSRLPSHTAFKRAGSTPPTRPASTRCSKTRRPTRPRSLAPENSRSPSSWGHTTARILSVRRSRRTGGRRDEMVAAAAANEAVAVSNVVDVAIGGMTGKRFDVKANPDSGGPLPGGPAGAGPQGPARTGVPSGRPRSWRDRDLPRLAPRGRSRGIPRAGDADRRELRLHSVVAATRSAGASARGSRALISTFSARLLPRLSDDVPDERHERQRDGGSRPGSRRGGATW